ncbi:MAG: FKBP-type peptidyl-prolyl cis-trans isomerase [Bacteroidales bacterium]|jgi:FKBP-type peptidyl-prolyl cis-trans isomerase FklB|nr:FKBP-type peptidyl-prolyl cis-trans isomerase [Bacteroidales bacterium]
MNGKKIIFFVCFGGFAALHVHAQTNLKNAADTASYYLGYWYGSQIMQQFSSGFNAAVFSDGVAVAAGPPEKKPDVTMVNAYLQNYFTQEQQRANRRNLEEGRVFLAQNAMKQGIVTLSSGLQYRIVKEGTGIRPTVDDEVEMFYHGTLTDGTVFDSAKDRGEPVTLGVKQVIPGFSEALQLMNVGAVWEIFIPAELGYGENVPQSVIKPNSVLVFEIELLRIVPKTPAIPQVEQNLMR